MALDSVIRRVASAVLFAVIALLAGCASLPTPPLSPPLPHDASRGFILDGRFSLNVSFNQPTQSHSGRLHWKYTPEAGEVLLSSPFGQGIAEIVSDAHGARLTTADGKQFTAPDAETLTREVLGYALPLSRLADWVRARPEAGEIRRDELGRTTHLRLDGWEIDYEYAAADPQSAPRRIVARRLEEFELRLIVDAWQPLPSAENTP